MTPCLIRYSDQGLDRPCKSQTGQESRFCKSLWGQLCAHLWNGHINFWVLRDKEAKHLDWACRGGTAKVVGKQPLRSLSYDQAGVTFLCRTWDRRRGSTLYHDCLSSFSSPPPLFFLSSPPSSLSSFPTPLTVACVCACVCLRTLSPVCACESHKLISASFFYVSSACPLTQILELLFPLQCLAHELQGSAL